MSNFVRLWTTDLVAGRAAQFDELSVTHSVALFQSLPGCVGAVFARSETTGYVLTAWHDGAAADAAAQLPVYREAVGAIMASGVITGRQSLQPLTVSASFMASPSVFCG